MQNGTGHVNGAAPMGQQTIQVNPQQAAALALQFLADVPHTRGQREAYDIAQMFLQAIVSGQVILAPPMQPAVQAPGADATAPPQ